MLGASPKMTLTLLYATFAKPNWTAVRPELARDFGFSEFEADLSTRPDKFVGDPQLWEVARVAAVP